MDWNIWRVWRLTVSLREAWLWQRQVYCQPSSLAKNLKKSISQHERMKDICHILVGFLNVVRNYQIKCAVPPRNSDYGALTTT